VDSAATLDRYPAPPQLLRSAPRPAAAADGGITSQLAFFVPASEPSPPASTGDGEPRPDANGVPDGETAPPLPTTRPLLWQIHDSYILAATRSGLLIIDQHSAHERVLFEALMRAFDEGGQPSQRLLFPLTLRFSPAEYAAVEANRELLERAGFEIEPFGGRTVIVHAAPTPHPYFDAERCLREVLTDLAGGSELTRAAHNQFERLAMTFACKAAIKAGQPLGAAELELLFERLFATELPYHDVHGRPTVIRLSLHELARRFGRHG
jgi:DNA mismatch repair protein MutL